MNKDYLLKNYKYILLSTLLFIFIFIAVAITILNLYIPMYKVSINNEFIGYVRNVNEFDEVFNTLKNEYITDSENTKIYLEENPKFNMIYVRQDAIDSQNIYTNLRANIKTEYTIYKVKVNNEEKMAFDLEESAKEYAENLKKEVENLEIIIEQGKINEKEEITTLDRANAIYKEIVSRYKPNAVVATTSTAKTTTSTASAYGGIWPTVTRYISCHYGGYAGHTGTDIAGKYGDPNYAYKSGKVVFAGWSGDYGYLVKIDHGGGIVTYYAHNSKLLVSVGDYVEIGQTIALQGSTGRSTGTHLHFEIRINGRAVNAYTYIKGL